jgi:thermitase
VAASLHRFLSVALPVAGAVALLAGGPVNAHEDKAVTATVAGAVKNPRPVLRSTKKAAKASKPSVKQVAKKRPAAKAKPPVKRAAPQSRVVPLEPAAPNDPLFSRSWSLSKTNAPAAWNVTTGAAETVVAILDTGIDLSHPDLQGSFVQGYDVVNRDGDPSDDHGHGTMVAGIVAARANNGLGGVGACSSCSLMAVKVIGANGSGSAADIADGIRWAADHGASVINMSFVLSGPDDGVAQAIAFAQERGVLVVAAAGNAGTADITFPAAHSGVLSVAGTDPSDARYDWSSFGGWVRLAAPGCSVTTAAGGGYGDFCGTSSATALVSGVAGLVRSFAPSLTANALEQTLSANALRVGDFVSAGRVDVGAAVGSLRAERVTASAPPASAGEQPATGISSE